MAAPQTVDEYRQQFPQASPCLHSNNGPPCVPCIERRILEANTLRAGTHPGTTPPSAEVQAHAAAQAEREPAPSAVVEPTPPAAPVAPPEEHTQPGPSTPPADAPAAPPIEPTVITTPASLPPIEPNPMVPSMSYTPPPVLSESVGPHPLGTPVELEEAGDPDAPDEDPLTFSPEQLARRAEIEAGTHPDVLAQPSIPPPPEPEPVVEERQPFKTYQSLQRNSVGQLYGWTGSGWELVDEAVFEVDLATFAIYHSGTPADPQAEIQARIDQSYADQAEVAAEEAAEAQEPAPAAPSAPPAPEAAPTPTEPVSVPVAALDAVALCPHKMPVTEPSTGRSAACSECLVNSDGPAPAGTPLVATRFQTAQHEGPCARTACPHPVHPGDLIGYVEGVGWCCPTCTKPRRPA